MRSKVEKNGKGGGSAVCFAQIVPAGTGTPPDGSLNAGKFRDWDCMHWID